jgi:hypothetical protein
MIVLMRHAYLPPPCAARQKGSPPGFAGGHAENPGGRGERTSSEILPPPAESRCSYFILRTGELGVNVFHENQTFSLPRPDISPVAAPDRQRKRRCRQA